MIQIRGFPDKEEQPEGETNEVQPESRPEGETNEAQTEGISEEQHQRRLPGKNVS